VTEEEVDVIDEPVIFDLVELALEWAACRRALTVLADLTDEERAEFALLAATTLLTP
jgi:hypothetical protein